LRDTATDIGGKEVQCVPPTGVVVTDSTDKHRVPAEGGHPNGGVGGAPTGNLTPTCERLLDLRSAGAVHERHRRGRQAGCRHLLRTDAGKPVDESVAEAGDVGRMGVTIAARKGPRSVGHGRRR
jgi:hypothetical protein